MKKEKGITWISLVITVIVLVILSAVGIYLALGNNGIVNKAEQAKEATLKEAATEKMNLKITNKQIEIYTQEQRMPTLQELSDELCEDNEIEYVELASKNVASLDKIEVGEAESIFTKLKDYPYEFEINSSLQLASIDGIKVATGKNDEVGIKAYVIGSIASYSTSGNLYAAFGYSSNTDYFTCEGDKERNYLIVNVLKDMNITIVLQESGRGNPSDKTIEINNSVVDTISMGLSQNYKYETTVSAGDVIKITATRIASVRGTAIGIFGIE